MVVHQRNSRLAIQFSIHEGVPVRNGHTFVALRLVSLEAGKGIATVQVVHNLLVNRSIFVIADIGEKMVTLIFATVVTSDPPLEGSNVSR